MPHWLSSSVGWVTKGAAWLVSPDGLQFLFGGIGVLALSGLGGYLIRWLWRQWKARRTARFCNLPGRNKVFTGRGKMLKKLRKELRGGKRVAITQVIEGLGGVGKTQLAIEYGHRHAGEYGIRWLIRAETQQQIKIGLAQLGVVLDHELAQVADIDQQVTCTLQLLNNAKGALLIYDNVERPGDLTGLCPSAGGHVLITSRYTDWETIARPISLETFTEGEALEYLRRRGLRDGEDELKALVARLGYLPLGLAMAAGYMLKQHISAGQYLGEYESDQAVLTAAPLPQDYNQAETLPAVFERSFTVAGEQDPLAMELLESLAFLAPDDIPLFVLDYTEAYPREHVSAGLAEAVGDERRRRELISTLEDYSLVSRADETLSIHRLTQDVLRHRLATDDALRQRPLYTAIELINAHVAHDVETDLREWAILDALTPHIRALRVAMADVPPGDCREPWSRLLNQFGVYCQTRAAYAEAKACYERALEIDEAAYGPEHPNVGACVTNLGGVLQDMGDLAGAKEYHERAMKIDEAVYGPDHPEVATDVNNLGGVLKDMGDLTGAKRCFERAEAIWSDKLGPEQPNVAIAINNLGDVLRAMGDPAGAKKCIERALKIDEAARGPDHPKVAIRVNNLGVLLAEMGKFAEARPHFERAVAIWTNKLGPEHPHTQMAMGWLERVRREMGE